MEGLVLKLRVRELCARRGIVKHVGKYLMRKGFGQTTAYQLAHDECVEIKLEYLLRLMILFKCERLNVLFQVCPENMAALEKYPFLKGLLHENETNDLNDVMERLPQKDVDDLLRQATERLEDLEKDDEENEDGEEEDGDEGKEE